MSFSARIASKLRACQHILRGMGKGSFAQLGEDRILDYLFTSLGVVKPTYLDIGANEPVLGSNTFFFYNRGSRGVLVEPEPQLFRNLQKSRPDDVCLNVGIGLSATEEALPFYVFSPVHSGWNTFSKTEAEQRKSEGHPYKSVIQVPLRPVNTILAEHFSKRPPDLISIDVEGLDFDILRSMDWGRFAPRALVVETVRFGDSAKATKQDDIIRYVVEQGYDVYADTHVNTIFFRTAS